MKRYCEACGKETDTKLIVRTERYEVRGEPFDVEAQVLVCAECGEDIFCEELDNITLIQAFKQYREKHGLLTPEEIAQIRRRYGLSQAEFARLLSWDDRLVRCYENGSVQSKTHDQLLVFLREPENMRSFLAEHGARLDEARQADVRAAVDRMISRRARRAFPTNRGGAVSFA